MQNHDLIKISRYLNFYYKSKFEFHDLDIIYYEISFFFFFNSQSNKFGLYCKASSRLHFSFWTMLLAKVKSLWKIFFVILKCYCMFYSTKEEMKNQHHENNVQNFQLFYKFERCLLFKTYDDVFFFYRYHTY